MADRPLPTGYGDDAVLAQANAALAPGTRVLTLAGALPVEALFPGDRVITRDGGARTLTGVLRGPVPAGQRWVQVARDALGGKPDHTLLLLPDQQVLLRDWRARALFHQAQALVPLRRLIDGTVIRWSETAPSQMVALQFTEPQVIYAGGLELLSAGARA